VSLGSPKIVFRLSKEFLAEIEATIAKRNATAFGVGWSKTDFLHAAIREKLAHMQRSRKPRKPKPKPEA